MTDPPDIAPGERQKYIITLRLPADVLRTATNPRTRQPRRDGKPRRVKLGRPRRVSVLAQQEAERARLQSHSRSSSQAPVDADEAGRIRNHSQERQSLPSRIRGKGGSRSQQGSTTRPVPYPQTQAQRRAAQQEQESLRIWQENEAPPLRLNPRQVAPQDYTNLPPNAVTLHWGSDGQRQMLQEAWETLNRIENKFSSLYGQPAQQEQDQRQGRGVMNALQQHPSTPQFFQPQPVRPPPTFFNGRRPIDQPDGYSVPANDEAVMHSNNRPFAPGHPHAHPVQRRQSSSPASTPHLQPVAPPNTTQRPTYHVPPADHEPLQQPRQSYQPLPTLPPLPPHPQTPIPGPRPLPLQILFGQPNNLPPDTHYTVNLVNNLHFRNPLLPALDPATQLDYSYLIRNHLRDKEANYIDPRRHLVGGYGEAREYAMKEDVDTYGGYDSGCAADTMDLDSGIGVDASGNSYGGDGDGDAVYDLTDIETSANVSHGSAGMKKPNHIVSTSLRANQTPDLDPTAYPTRISLPAKGVEAEFLWDKLLSDVRRGAAEMKRGRRQRDSICADVADACVYGVRWREGSRGRFVEDKDGLGTYTVEGVDASGRVQKQELEKLGYRRDEHSNDGEDDGRYIEIDALRQEDRVSGLELRRECDRRMELSDPWRRATEAEAEAGAEVGEYGFSVGGDDKVLGMVDMEEEDDESQLYGYHLAKPQIWYVPGASFR